MLPAPLSKISPNALLFPLLYVRGDADGRSPNDYVKGLKEAGARHVTGEVLRESGEFAPLEVPQAFVQMVARFAAACRGGPEARTMAR